MKAEVGMMKSNDLDKYLSRLNEIMENSPPKTDISENLKVSPELKAKIEKLNLENNDRVKKESKIIAFRKKVIIKSAVACIALLLITFPQQVFGYARAVVTYIVNSFEKYSEISFTGNDETVYNSSLGVSYEFNYPIPNGYVLKEENKENGYFAILENQSGNEIYVTIESNDISQLKLNTEKADVSYMTINGVKVMQVYENGSYTVFWVDEQYNYEISSNSDLDVLVYLAEKLIK